MPFAFNERRDAWSTIAGFVLQVDITIVRWLDLQENEVLELECGEDLDLVQELNAPDLNEKRLLEQVKRRSSALTLRAGDALEALANFCQHRSANPQSALRFRFLTTGQAGKEQGWSGDAGGIQTWEAIRRGELVDPERSTAIEAIRSLLASVGRPTNVHEAEWHCLQNVVSDSKRFEDFIANFEWSIGSGDIVEIEAVIKNNLLETGYASDCVDVGTLFDRLFAFVFRRLCSPERKCLTTQELAKEVAQRQALTEADRSRILLLREVIAAFGQRLSDVETVAAESAAAIQGLSSALTSMASGQNRIAAIDIATVSVALDAPELVVPAIPRTDSVRNAIATLSRQPSLNITGEPGSGKTQLSLLIARQSDLPIAWLDIPRNHSVQQACAVLDAAIASRSGIKRTGLHKSWYESAVTATGPITWVIDNLPQTLPGDSLNRRIELLSRTVAQHGGTLLLISYFALPKTTVEIAQISDMVAPRLTQAEIGELLFAFGATPDLARQLTTLVETATGGVAALVAAVARYLSSQSWKLDHHQFEAILKADFAQSIRHDARTLIELTVPDPESRELLYRLALTIGGFSRHTVSDIARIPQSIRLPNEKLDHLLGLWVQPFLGDKFLLSPLIDPAVSARLDQKTRTGVHAQLGLSIVSRQKLEPLDVVTSVFHFSAAGLFNQATIIMIQALTAFTEKENAIDEWGMTTTWTSAPLSSEIDINLRLYIRALQTIALDQQGRDISYVLADLQHLIEEAGLTAWGTALASSFIAIRLFRKYPALANTCILTALRSGKLAKLPDGSSLPAGPFSLEGLFWATAIACSSTEDVESWMDAVKQLTPDEVSKLGSSNLAEDNATVLTDGVWFREYEKSESQRDWGPVENLVERLEAFARNIGLRVLEVAAIRTRIMLLAEWRHDISGALRLAESTLQRLTDNDSRFLVTEVMGRQLSYAERTEEAVEWLKSARSIAVPGHSLWKRNVLITLAEEVSKQDQSLAVEYTSEALEIARKDFNHERVIEALAEHAIALWNTGRREDAFRTMESAVRDLLGMENESSYWKKLFLAVFHTVIYFSSMALFGSTSGINGFVPPTQCRFLSLHTVDATAFKPAQKSFIQMRMAMLAEGLGDVEAVGKWSDESLKVASSIREAETINSLAWLSIAPALLEGAYGKAASAALMMANAVLPERSAVASMLQQVPTAQAATALLNLSLPLAFRLATLRTQAGLQSQIEAAIDQIAGALPADSQYSGFVSALRSVFVENLSWEELKRRSDKLMPQVNETGSAFVYLIGAASRRPLPGALSLQVWLAREMEKLLPTHRTMREKLIHPFFRGFWLNTLDSDAHQFRTAEAYTRRVIESASSTESGINVRSLLSSMAFCLGVTLRDDLKEWLS